MCLSGSVTTQWSHPTTHFSCWMNLCKVSLKMCLPSLSCKFVLVTTAASVKVKPFTSKKGLFIQIRLMTQKRAMGKGFHITLHRECSTGLRMSGVRGETMILWILKCINVMFRNLTAKEIGGGIETAKNICHFLTWEDCQTCVNFQGTHVGKLYYFKNIHYVYIWKLHFHIYIFFLPSPFGFCFAFCNNFKFFANFDAPKSKQASKSCLCHRCLKRTTLCIRIFWIA